MKKDETRFAIRFNPAAPRHQKAMDVLATAGRRKASLIADAVCVYLTLAGGDEAAFIPPFSPASPPVSVNAPMIHTAVTKNDSLPQAHEIKVSADEGADNSQGSHFDNNEYQAILDGLSVFHL